LKLETPLEQFGKQVKSLLVEYQLTSKIIAYVKDKGINMNTYVFALTSVVSCAPLQLATLFNGTCFDHVGFKECQYATNDIKIGVGMKEVNVIED
jgi:hypothetical protein